MIAVPQAAIDLAKRFEGFHRVPKADPLRRAHPYICPAGYWTIGFGHLCDPKHPPITEAEAEIYLARDQMTALSATLRYCPAGTGIRTRGAVGGHRGFHLQPRCRAAADLNFAAADQSARLVKRGAGIASLGERWGKSAAGVGGKAGSGGQSASTDILLDQAVSQFPAVLMHEIGLVSVMLCGFHTII